MYLKVIFNYQARERETCFEFQPSGNMSGVRQLTVITAPIKFQLLYLMKFLLKLLEGGSFNFKIRCECA